MGSSTPCCVLIVDDEPLSRRLLRAQLDRYEWLGPIVEAPSVAEAIPLLNDLKPPIIFLDIHMPRLDGFALLPLLTYPAHIVFVTSDDRSAIRAFEVEAADYLLKPVHPNRLSVTLARLKKRIARHETPNSTTILRDGNKLLPVAFEKIAVIEADGSFTRIHLFGQPSIFIRRAISEWEALLPHLHFLRADRSFIFNLRLIDRLETVSRNETLVHLRETTPSFTVGRAGTARLKKAFDRIPGGQ